MEKKKKATTTTTHTLLSSATTYLEKMREMARREIEEGDDDVARDGDGDVEVEEGVAEEFLEKIPYDIEEEIIKILPIKSLVRFRLVSKQ